MVLKVWEGAMYLQVKIDTIDALVTPDDFSMMQPPVRCYFVEYDNQIWSWRFFWSKPGEQGISGNFITSPMKEDPPKGGERYFNDANLEDPRIWNTAFTLINKESFNKEEQSFFYRETFDNWNGAFMGGLTLINHDNVHSEWKNLFVSNTP